MEQLIFHGKNVYGKLTGYLREHKVRSVLLVCGNSIKNKPVMSNIRKALSESDTNAVEFHDFHPNPSYASVVKGVHIFRTNRCEAILAVGGGSAMDVAKCIKLYESMEGDGEDGSFLNGEAAHNDIHLIVLPTTAGTGSEATRYAVIYYYGEKKSVTHDSLIPDVVIRDSSVLKSLPSYERKASVMDALCHGIESFWSVNSTEESKQYAKEAVTLILEQLDGYLKNDDRANEQMSHAAYLAGKAINITQTTGGHAMSYQLTSRYGVAHGHAVAVCVREIWPWMLENTVHCTDNRGEKYLKEMLMELASVFGCDTPQKAAEKFRIIVDKMAFSEIKAAPVAFDLLKKSVNPERLKNTPIRMTEDDIDALYRKILTIKQGINVNRFLELLGSDFYTGVPDSRLRPLCDYLMNQYGANNKHHVIAANEGNAVGIASGYHLTTGKVPVVYLQNSGEGNIINPLASLINEKVYAIPCIFIIGWRGEPGVQDEPQHIFQGAVTCKLLEVMDVDYFIVEKETREKDVEAVMKRFRVMMSEGKQVAFVIKEGGLYFDEKIKYRNSNQLLREDALKQIVTVCGENPVICTTGKASRELFEIREHIGHGHKTDFLTVGSMGHASSIALGVALHSENRRVWCIDGDGAALMHLGAMTVIGHLSPENLVHIVINNGAHESVGGMPTAANEVSLCRIAKACGYTYVHTAANKEELERTLSEILSETGLVFLEIKCAIGSREDLGRPTTCPSKNKKQFMESMSHN